MSKVICDVCGTTYPETAARCPICGCAKSGSEQTAAASSAAEAGVSYSHVRGGRFSKSNVRKRTQGGKEPQRRAAATPVKKETGRRDTSNDKPLIIAIILLLIAIVLVATYMIVDYTAGKNGGGKKPQTAIPCTAIKLSKPQITFDALENCQWTLQVTKIPSNTTDKVEMTIDDTSIATFDKDGRIIPVAPGETVVRVKCGQAVAECKIVCTFSDQQPPEGTEPPVTEPPVTQPPVTPEPEFEFRFNTKYIDDNGVYDVTLTTEKTWRAYRSDLPVAPSEITWSSDNTSVCTVKDGIVTVTGKGDTLIHAEYKGKRYDCKIRVTVAPTSSSSSSGYTISHTDVTLETIGESFNLFLKNSHGENQTVTWKASADGYVTISGNKITAAKSTADLADDLVKVSCDYQGNTYTCKVRIN